MIVEYFKKSDTVLAVRYNRIGDPVNEGVAIFLNDPRILQAYKRDGVHHETKCIHCEKPVVLHAYIAELPPPAAPHSGLRVDPSTGEHSMPAPVPAEEPYPRSYAKKDAHGHWEHYTAVDAAGDKEALSKGFHLEHPKHAAPQAEAQVPEASKPGYPKTMVKFGAASEVVHNAAEEKEAASYGYRSGLVVCPGQYILLHKTTRAMEAVGENYFNSEYERK